MGDMRFPHGELRAIVQEAWTQTLGADDAGPDTGWEASGADSLLTMHLVLRLEKRLGRRIPYDLIDPDTTVTLLVERLAAAVDDPTGGDELPIFLSPGVFGDEPILADFRRWFAGDPAFALVDLPPATDPAATLRSLNATGLALASAIQRLQPAGPIAVAGFSFGGAVAFEAARILAAHGRDVALCLILDTHIEDPSTSTSQYRPKKDLWFREFVTTLLAPRSDYVRRAALQIAGRLSEAAKVRLARRYLLRLRGEALRQWRPDRADFPVLLVLSDDAEPELVSRWRSRSDHFSMIAVPGGHKDLFRPVAMQRLGPSVRAALGRSVPGEAALARRA